MCLYYEKVRVNQNNIFFTVLVDITKEWFISYSVAVPGYHLMGAVLLIILRVIITVVFYLYPYNRGDH